MEICHSLAEVCFTLFAWAFLVSQFTVRRIYMRKIICKGLKSPRARPKRNPVSLNCLRPDVFINSREGKLRQKPNYKLTHLSLLSLLMSRGMQRHMSTCRAWVAASQSEFAEHVKALRPEELFPLKRNERIVTFYCF